MLVFALERNQVVVYAIGSLFFIITFLVIAWNMMFILMDSIKGVLSMIYLKRTQKRRAEIAANQGHSGETEELPDTYEEWVLGVIKGYYLKFRSVVRAGRQ